MRHTCLILLAAAAAVAHTPDGITVSVSRNINIPPDQAEFLAVVTASLDTTQQQVTQALQEAGVPSPTLISVGVGAPNYNYQPSDATQVPPSQLFFQVTFTTTPAAVKDVAKKLDAARASLPAGLAALQYAAALTASQAAVEAAHQSALNALLADARSKGQLIATAAGLKLGPIAGIVESFNGVSAYSGTGYYLANAILSTASFSSGTTSASQYSFYATVKFAAQ